MFTSGGYEVPEGSICGMLTSRLWASLFLEDPPNSYMIFFKSDQFD